MQSGITLCTNEVVFDGNFLTCEMLNEFAFHVYISGNNFWKRKSLLACQSNSHYTTSEHLLNVA